MNHHLIIDGQSHVLTTEHASSSHGVPVLVWMDNDGDGRALGPDDTCTLRIESGTDDALRALNAAGFSFTDCRPVEA